MAKFEIKKRTINLWENLWWKFMPGTVITVKWPVGWAILDDDGNGGITSTESADPNDHYRPWLEKHVGKQYWDWDWRLGSVAATNADRSVIGFDTLKIKFRKSKEKYASMALLRWT